MSKKSKKKANNNKVLEAVKAQSAVLRGSVNELPQVITSKIPTMSAKSAYELPIKEIKYDLVKNLLFVVFSVGLLIFLSITKFGYSQLSGFFKI